MRLESEHEIHSMRRHHYLIEQGYLIVSKGMSLRVRRSRQIDLLHAPPRHILTFKSNNAGRVIEIEKKMDQRDFGDLWPQCLNKLRKIRHIVHEDKSHKWEIDFFKDHNNETYFAMAEYEMPEGQKKPDVIPDFIASNLLFEVPLTDCRFSSKLLGDVRYAIDLRKNLSGVSDARKFL